MRVANAAAVLSFAAGLISCGGAEPSPATPSAATAPSASAPAAKGGATAKTEPAQTVASTPAGQTPGAIMKPDEPPPGASTDRLMRAHFIDALLIRKAVIAGTPERAAGPAEALAKAENLQGLPPTWRTSVERLQQVAARINNSTSPSQAAAATADLGVTCGDCHQKLGGPKAPIGSPPTEGTGIVDRMQRHAWATERLWEGLTVPSGDAWNAGAKALSATAFPAEILQQGGVHARAAAGDFAKLVVKAPTRKTVQERAALYAELLVTCGGCHRAINEAGSK